MILRTWPAVALLLSLAGAPVRAGDLKNVSRPDAADSLINPKSGQCLTEALRRAGDLKNSDRALAWTRGKEGGGAIPLRMFLNRYPVISDLHGIFVHDPEAGFARGFAANPDVRFQGWRGGIMSLRHADGTLYSSLTGVAFEGPKKGSRLTPLPSAVVNWGDWTQRFPRSVTFDMDERYKPADPLTIFRDGSRQSRGPGDDRVPADELVLGVWDGKQARAFRIAEFQSKPIRVDGDIAVFVSAAQKSAMAFGMSAERLTESGRPESTAVRIGRIGEHPWGDLKTGSGFDEFGRGISGSLKGWTLAPIDAVVVKWWAWSAEYPDTTVVD
ncbi:MAG: DUF3179 domain-containing protein [Gemmataceae bacterium]|nr:DUF3179 domain-containing protein [Gemmataceae bacterium]